MTVKICCDIERVARPELDSLRIAGLSTLPAQTAHTNGGGHGTCEHFNLLLYAIMEIMRDPYSTDELLW